MGRFFFYALCLIGAAGPVFSDAALVKKATALIEAGQFSEARQLTEAALKANPADADALVLQGTAVLYEGVRFTPDESIYTPQASPDPQATVPTALARTVAGYWQQVPALDPARSYLWGDIAELLFRSGASQEAKTAAQAVLDDPQAGAESLASAANVFALSLDWPAAAAAEDRIRGSRAGQLYRGLDLWRQGKDGWRPLLADFVQHPGTRPAGTQLAAYVSGSAMRDTPDGYQAALATETVVAGLIVRQKWTDRYPDQLRPRFELARLLAQYGSYEAAAAQFGEIEKREAAKTTDEKLSVAFQRAWALQAAGRDDEALAEWHVVAESRDFYVRTAALWFLGRDAIARGKPGDAKVMWTYRPALPADPPGKDGRLKPQRYLPAAIEEPAGSKYATWAAAEFKKLG